VSVTALAGLIHVVSTDHLAQPKPCSREVRPHFGGAFSFVF
jgi:hypothetical protein